MRDAVRLYIFAGLSGCHTVKLLVHTVKYSLVRKTDLVHDLGNGKLRGAEQTPGMGDPHLIEILQERNSHMLFEKAAEIFLAEADSGRNIVQGDFFRIMLSNIGNNHAECVIWLFLISCGPQRGIHRKRLDQVGQHQKSDTIRAHGAGAFFFNTGTGEVTGKLTERKVFCLLGVIQRQWLTLDVVQFQIRAVQCHLLFVHMNA